MSDSHLSVLVEAICQGLQANDFDARVALVDVVAERYGKPTVKKTGIRNAYRQAAGAEGGVPYAGLTNFETTSQGAYGGASLAWFPTEEHGSLITFVVGTTGLSPDEGILTRPGHRRRIAALRRMLSRSGVITWTKPDPSSLGVQIPQSIRARFPGFDQAFNRYGSEMYCIAKVPKDRNLAYEVVRAFLDVYAFERGWQALKGWEEEFKDLHGRLMEDVFPTVSPESVNALLRRRRFVILQGPPGTGKTRLAEVVRKNFFDSNGMTVQFHPAVAYEDFIVGLAPEPREGSLKFAVRKGWLLQAAECSKNAPCLLVVDEINRADLGKVLGEAIFLFEADEIGGERPRSVRLPYAIDAATQGSQDFSLPQNLYVLATMNTADRSIASLDLAVRRRFAFVTMMPDREVVKSQGLPLAIEVFDRLLGVFVEHAPDDALDLLPGHSYFLASNQSELLERFRYELLPLLNEYLRQGLVGRATSDLYAVRDEIEDRLSR
ncbi:MAG: AAA family ATPase [Blastocatellia bacterium]|nr:AAA family ATPase [Blastocatellia bacterium]